jgi:ribosome assembly protein RRB1
VNASRELDKSIEEFLLQLGPYLMEAASSILVLEDLQWSPNEITVFASCSSNQSIRIWDIRSKAHKSVTSLSAAHNSDINVISWNRSTLYLLLSGDDEGQTKVWDLRNI